MNLQANNISAKSAFHPKILRIAKIARQKSRINAKAKSEQNQSRIAQAAVLKRKQKPGAHKSNRNALKHGLYSAPMIALKRRVAGARAGLKQAAAMMDMETAAMQRG